LVKLVISVVSWHRCTREGSADGSTGGALILSSSWLITRVERIIRVDILHGSIVGIRITFSSYWSRRC
jgi:hypothetical protein